MTVDRDNALRQAEKLLRQGRLEAAIEEYCRVVETRPDDWTTGNALGDLYVRAGRLEKAVGQYNRIAGQLFRDGFLSKAAAFYKKVLKLWPGDEEAQQHLGEIAARQGLLADARAYLTAVLDQRRARGDQRGVSEIVVQLGRLDPADLDARLGAARALSELGDAAGATAELHALANDFSEREQPEQALAVLREIVSLAPEDTEARARLARVSLANGDVAGAREQLTREVAGDDPDLMLALAELEVRTGRVESAVELIREVLASRPERRDQVTQLGWSLCESDPVASFACLDAVADCAIAKGDWAAAAAVLHEFVTRAPGQVPALLKLVEVCVDGGLEATMYSAQAELADAYLQEGRAAEARVIAEDLVAREPWERVHLERFRQALIQLGESDPDGVIAQRLSGESPFTSTDRLVRQLTDPAAGAGDEAPADADPAERPATPAERPATPAERPATPAERPATPARAVDVVEPPAQPDDDGHGGAGSNVIDLTAALADLAGGEPDEASDDDSAASLDDAFREFRDEVARQSTAESAGQQYKLALTYREMGMIEEAISALEAAARSPEHRFEAAAMLGRMYRDRGSTQKAVEWLEHAAEVPAPSVEDGRALLYDLGALLEDLGERARSLAVFRELQADVGTYRDVDQRVDRLSGV